MKYNNFPYRLTNHFVSLLTIVLLIIGCKNKSVEIEKTSVIDTLIKEGHYGRANVVLDSLISKDTTNGMYFYEKGVVSNYFDDFESAIKFFKHAHRLNYRRADCVDWIKLNQGLLNIRLKYKRYGKPDKSIK